MIGKLEATTVSVDTAEEFCDACKSDCDGNPLCTVGVESGGGESVGEAWLPAVSRTKVAAREPDLTETGDADAPG